LYSSIIRQDVLNPVPDDGRSMQYKLKSNYNDFFVK